MEEKVCSLHEFHCTSEIIIIKQQIKSRPMHYSGSYENKNEKYESQIRFIGF